MKQRITAMIIALAAIVGSATGQTISVEPIEMEVGAQATLSVGVSGLSDVTALQFNLQLPEGLVLDESAVEKSSAASVHELAIRPLSNGRHLFVLYNMDKATVGNGEILRLPITAGSEAGSFSGNLTTFRTATTDAVSHAGTNASFQITVTDKATGIHSIDNGKLIIDNWYLVDGVKLNGEPTKPGLYIRNGKKVVK
ncbi:MAG: hypothetical protein IKS72_01725 [Prevotella sp.]|nr:hypothetical protein [Prevotella sp.]